MGRHKQTVAFKWNRDYFIVTLLHPCALFGAINLRRQPSQIISFPPNSRQIVFSCVRWDGNGVVIMSLLLQIADYWNANRPDGGGLDG